MTCTARLGSGTDRGAYQYICVFGGFLYAALLIAPLLATRLQSAYALSATETGLLFALENAAFSFAAVPAYLWATRLNLRTVSYVCTSVVVAGNIASGWVSEYPALIVARMITALAAGSITVVILSIGGRTTNPGRSFGIFVVAQLSVGATALATIPRLFPDAGVREIYWLIACLTLVGFLVIRNIDPWVLRTTAVEVADAGTNVSPKTDPQRFVLGAVAIVAFYVGLSGVWTFIGEIGSAGGAGEGAVSTILSVATVAGILSAMVAAIIGDNPRQFLLMLIGYVAFCASVLLLLGGPAMIRFAVAAIAFKFAWTFILPYLFAGLSSLSTGPHVMSTTNLMVGIGFALGPMVAGYLIDITGGYTAMLVVGSLAMAMSMLCAAISLRPTPKSEQRWAI